MKKSVFLLILSLGLGAAGATNIISMSQDNVTGKQQEEATVQTGVLTEKQRHHRKLYKEYRRDKKIPELATERSFDFGITIGTPIPGGLPGVSQPTFSERITTLTCDADAVVVGAVKNKTSQLTEDEDFIFTDYEIIVEEVVKNNASDPIALNTEITVSNPGGKIQLNNRIVDARDLSFPPLVIGERYLLLLKSTSISGGYKAVNKESRFHLTNGSVETIPIPNRRINAKNKPRPNNLGEASTLLRQVRETVASGCVGEKKGVFGNHREGPQYLVYQCAKAS
ncbi:MAG: hypothetical protein ACRD5H_15060 [Nitrososphaerales archaeon]